MPQKFPLVILGGSSFIAGHLIRRLRALGHAGEVVSRKPIAVAGGFTATAFDFSPASRYSVPANAAVISLLPLWVLTDQLASLTGAKAIIALGSTSQLSKASSTDATERATAIGLANAETALRGWCACHDVPFTLLRPTMIYDGAGDRNIARMARFIRRARFLPLAAPARGLRQPIHADDVAKAIIGALANDAVRGKTLNIAGGEVLSYRAMAERVFAALRMKPRLLMLPAPWLETAFVCAAGAGVLDRTAFGSSIFRRMNEDLVYDAEEGLRLLDYRPRRFEPRMG